MFGLSYILYKALALFVMPLGLSLLVLIAAIILLWFKKRKSSIALFLFLAAWLWLWSTPVWCNFISGILESQYTWKPAESYPVADAIVSLGGGVRGSALKPVTSHPETGMAGSSVSPAGGLASATPSLDLGSAADRELFAAQLYHAGKSKVIIVTAGVDPMMGTGVAALAQKQFLEMLGVPAAAIRVEGRSLNTIDNAREVQRMLEPVKGKTILLVTSAIHMPRSYWLFSRTGLQVIPAPTDFETIKPPFSLNLLLPDAVALDGSTRAMKEIIGLWATKLSKR